VKPKLDKTAGAPISGFHVSTRTGRCRRKADPPKVGQVVRGSHERWDGGGYPDGLAGEQIPLESRIVSTCDAFNAMTTTRSYRQALPTAEAIAELRRCTGAQFDPQVVDAVLRVVARG
jgi:HD-GYP domain-containing protein (c-di-GMP phosphodiesterase class II)